MKHTVRTTFLAALLAAAALPAAAQDTIPAAEAPARVNSFSLNFGYGNAIGLWRDLSPRVRAGVELGGYVARAETDETEHNNHGLIFRPSVMLFSGEGALRPYTTVGVFVQRYSQEVEQDEGGFRNDQTDVGAQAGVGLEWRPASRVTVGGHVGISGYRTSVESGDPFTDLAQADGWNLGTFNSGIALNLFF